MFLKDLKNKIKKKKVKIAIIGLGYVGLPLSLVFSEKKFKVIGLDIDKKKIKKINAGQSYINTIPNKKIRDAKNNLLVSTDFSFIKKCDVIIICVPTPLKKDYKPDLSYLNLTIKKILKYLKKGQLISLESTSYPGTTKEEIVDKIKNKYEIGKNFFVTFSPEREDPGNKNFKTKNIPKIISGHTTNCLKIAKLLYESVFKQTVSVSNTRTAEFTKLLENIYRSINIGLVNEMKIIAKLMKIDIHESIKAASSKPFGYTPFSPGPGMGGHCIPIDPFYMAWKSKKFGYEPKFIKSSGIINNKMPIWTVQQISKELKKRKYNFEKVKILIVGISYKKNINDTRESPALEIMDLLKRKNFKIGYYDPFIKKLYRTRKFNFNLKGEKLDKKIFNKYNVTLIVTDHDKINYSLIEKNSKLIFDCRDKINKDLLNVIKL